MADRSLSIWIVAAGTGGHVFPGLNVAHEIKKIDPSTRLLFWGTANRLEAKAIPQAGFEIVFISAGRWKGSGIFSRLAAPLLIATGFFQAIRFVFIRRPDVLLSVGGYVSIPISLACFVGRVPIFLVEPNRLAGLANKIISKLAKGAFSATQANARRVFSCPVFELGVPVRTDLREYTVARNVKKIVIMGGSLGSRWLCLEGLDLAKKIFQNEYQGKIILQTGEQNMELTKNKVKELALDNSLAEGRIEILPFIEDVPSMLVDADIVIARAGAMTVNELAVTGNPTVFVPYPFAADDHQRHNAQSLVQAGAALMVDERDPEAKEKFLTQVLGLLDANQGYEQRQNLSSNLKKLGRREAAQQIARTLLSSIS